MTPEEVLKYLPVSESFFTLPNGTQYGYEKHNGQRIGFRKNGDGWHEIDFNDAPEDFKREAEARAIEEKERRGNTPKSNQEIEDEARIRAVEVLGHGDPRAFILNTFKTQHIGDIETAEGILIGTANQRVANSKGVQAAVYGESGRGKSHAARAMLHLFPLSYCMIETLSDKALFYMTVDELRAGTTIFSDDAKISEGIETLIKRSTAFFQEPTIHRVATKEGGTWKNKKLTIPARINWLLTSVSSQGSEQLINRQIAFGVDESEAQDEKVTEFELMKALKGLPEFEETDDVLTCREIIRTIKEDDTGTPRLFAVKIPFAARIEWHDKTNRRNLPIFLDMVKGYAVLNFKQRETDTAGALLATEDDFKSAERLYNTRGGFQKLHINEREKEMLQHIAQSGGELTTTQLMEKMKLSGVRVRQIAERLEIVLPNFYVEKRSEREGDANDDKKSTNTQRNYFCYSGNVTLGTFSSVVSLRAVRASEANGVSRADDEHEESDFNHFNPTLTPLKIKKVKVGKGQHGLNSLNRDYNNKDYLNKILIKGESQNNIPTRAHAYTQSETLSRNFETQTEATNKAIHSIEGLEASARDKVEDLKSLKVGLSQDTSELAQLIYRILEKTRRAGTNINDADDLAEAVTITIQNQHAEWREYDIKSFYAKLAESDAQIQGLIADIIGGANQ